MCGVALKHAGHTVTIIEKADDERQSHMAGVCLGLDAQRFLARHDRFDGLSADPICVGGIPIGVLGN